MQHSNAWRLPACKQRCLALRKLNVLHRVRAGKSAVSLFFKHPSFKRDFAENAPPGLCVFFLLLVLELVCPQCLNLSLLNVYTNNHKGNSMLHQGCLFAIGKRRLKSPKRNPLQKLFKSSLIVIQTVEWQSKNDSVAWVSQRQSQLQPGKEVKTFANFLLSRYEWFYRKMCWPGELGTGLWPDISSYLGLFRGDRPEG